MAIEVVSLHGGDTFVMTTYTADSAIADGVMVEFAADKISAYDAITDIPAGISQGTSSADGDELSVVNFVPGLVLRATYSTGTPALGAQVEVNVGGADVKAVTTGKSIGRVIEIVDATAKIVKILTSTEA